VFKKIAIASNFLYTQLEEYHQPAKLGSHYIQSHLY